MPAQRSAGVTAAAVISILGSALCLLFALLMLLTSFLFRSQAPTPSFTRVAVFFECALFGALAAWGIATAIGLFRLRGWARISAIVFSLLLASGALFLAFFRPPPQPGAPPAVMTVVMVGIACFYACLAALGGWWLYLFNTLSVRTQFGAEISEPGGRPLSISIIGWWLLAGAVGCFAGAFTSFPVMVGGFVFRGWLTHIFFLAFAAIQGWLGGGLLRLKPLTRIVAIAFYAFAGVSSLLFAFLPGYEQRIRDAMDSMPFGFNEAFQASSAASLAAMRPGLIVGALTCVLPIWFLVARRREFRGQ
jgi:hypothetical protein